MFHIQDVQDVRHYLHETTYLKKLKNRKALTSQDKFPLENKLLAAVSFYFKEVLCYVLLLPLILPSQ